MNNKWPAGWNRVITKATRVRRQSDNGQQRVPTAAIITRSSRYKSKIPGFMLNNGGGSTRPGCRLADGVREAMKRFQVCCAFLLEAFTADKCMLPLQGCSHYWQYAIRIACLGSLIGSRMILLITPEETSLIRQIRVGCI